MLSCRILSSGSKCPRVIYHKTDEAEVLKTMIAEIIDTHVETEMKVELSAPLGLHNLNEVVVHCLGKLFIELLSIIAAWCLKSLL